MWQGALNSGNEGGTINPTVIFQNVIAPGASKSAQTDKDCLVVISLNDARSTEGTEIFKVQNGRTENISLHTHGYCTVTYTNGNIIIKSVLSNYNLTVSVTELN